MIPKPSCILFGQFRLADTKYDAVIATLQQDEDEQIQYAKALELSGGEAALETYQKVSTLARLEFSARWFQDL